MSILRNIKKNLNEHRISEWYAIEKEEDLEVAHQLSFKKPVVLFKHSTSCGISARAKYLLESEWGDLGHDIGFFYLDLLQYRPLSNRISSDYHVVHQSPQIIILHRGEAVYDTSHHRISIADIGHQLTLVGKGSPNGD